MLYAQTEKDLTKENCFLTKISAYSGYLFQYNFSIFESYFFLKTYNSLLQIKIKRTTAVQATAKKPFFY